MFSLRISSIGCLLQISTVDTLVIADSDNYSRCELTLHGIHLFPEIKGESQLFSFSDFPQEAEDFKLLCSFPLDAVDDMRSLLMT